ncbi:MAG: hypothetical protein RR501_10550 [Cloacibacillus sp.]
MIRIVTQFENSKLPKELIDIYKFASQEVLESERKLIAEINELKERITALENKR